MFAFTHKTKKIVKQDILEQCRPERDWKTIIFIFFMMLALCASGATYFFFKLINTDMNQQQAIISGTQLIKREALNATLTELTRRSDAFINAPLAPIEVSDPSR
jgi:hypothetical protein